MSEIKLDLLQVPTISVTMRRRRLCFVSASNQSLTPDQVRFTHRSSTERILQRDSASDRRTALEMSVYHNHQRPQLLNSFNLASKAHSISLSLRRFATKVSLDHSIASKSFRMKGHHSQLTSSLQVQQAHLANQPHMRTNKSFRSHRSKH